MKVNRETWCDKVHAVKTDREIVFIVLNRLIWGTVPFNITIKCMWPFLAPVDLGSLLKGKQISH